MTKTRLLSTVAATLLIGMGAASAQTMKDQAPPERSPAAQQKAPAEKVGPAMNAGQQKGPETTGQAAPSDPKMAPGRADATKPADKQTGADIKAKSDANVAPNKAAADKAAQDGKGKVTPDKAAQDKPAASPSTAQSNDRSGAATTGQGAAAGSAKLSTEQRTKITTVIKQQKVERVEPSKLNVSITVGTRVPTSVRFHPLPREVIVIYPEWRGYDYILVGDQIVVLDPRTHEIVAILEA